jgi:hypothetical protein
MSVLFFETIKFGLEMRQDIVIIRCYCLFPISTCLIFADVILFTYPVASPGPRRLSPKWPKSATRNWMWVMFWWFCACYCIMCFFKKLCESFGWFNENRVKSHLFMVIVLFELGHSDTYSSFFKSFFYCFFSELVLSDPLRLEGKSREHSGRGGEIVREIGLKFTSKNELW